MIFLSLINFLNFVLFSFCIANSARNNVGIALVCFDENLATESVSMMWKSTLVCIVSIISAIFLIATLAVYVILPELRELQDKAMMAAVTTLAVSYTVLSIQHVRPIIIDDDYTTCVSFGTYMHNYRVNWCNILPRGKMLHSSFKQNKSIVDKIHNNQPRKIVLTLHCVIFH